MSGACISACVQPLDVIRTRMQGDAAHGTVRGTAATLRLIVREGGLRWVLLLCAARMDWGQHAAN